jgi:hypothetical protein
MCFRVLIIICLLSVAGESVYAQNFRTPNGVNPARMKNQQKSMDKMEPFEGAGTIEALAAGKIQILTSSNEQWIIGLLPTTKLQVVGKADVQFLRAGMFVQFKAEIDKHNAAVNPIDELTITSLSKEKLPGVFPLGENQHEKSDGKTQSVGLFNVVGRINNMQGNKLQINIGNGTVFCDISDNAKIHVDLADISMVRKGDKISAKGMKMRGVPGQAQAMQVKIELAETLSGMGETKGKPQTKVKSSLKLKAKE